MEPKSVTSKLRNKIQDFHVQNQHSTTVKLFHQQSGLKNKENKLAEYATFWKQLMSPKIRHFIYYIRNTWNFFFNLMLEKDGEDQLDRMCEEIDIQG